MIHQKTTPLISVVIAAYNSRRTIEQCLLAIENQTYPNIEIIVVDGLHYDTIEQEKCRKIIEQHARYIQDGPERSIQRNRGINEAKGEFILVLDQDMYLQPEVVKECFQKMSLEEFIAIVIPEISIGKGFWTKCVAFERYISVFLEEGMNECCRFFKKKDALAVGGYDPEIVGAEDSDFHYRMKAAGRIGKIKAYAHHDEGYTRFWGRVKKKYYYSAAFRKYLRRRPGIALRQFSPFKGAYMKHIPILLQNPLTTAGMIVLRGAEVVAGFLGLLLKR